MEAKNGSDAAGIAASMLNRMNAKNITFNNNNWLYQISIHHPGRTVDEDIHSVFNAYSTKAGSDYQILLNKSDDAFYANDSKWNSRLFGAQSGFYNFQDGFDDSGGAYFWNAKSQITNMGGPYKNIENGKYTVTYSTGSYGTTFFRYTNPSKTWP